MAGRLISTGSPSEETAGFSQAVSGGISRRVSRSNCRDYAAMMLRKRVGYRLCGILNDCRQAQPDGLFARRCRSRLSSSREYIGQVSPIAATTAVWRFGKPELRIEITAREREV